MEQKDIEQHTGKKRRIILRSGRVYTCTITHVSKSRSKGDALVDIIDDRNHHVSFSTDAIDAIENLEDKKSY